MNIGPYIIERADLRQTRDIYDLSYQSDALFKMTKVKFPRPPAKRLGHGTKGAAYDLGGGKIAKITEDATEAKASSVIAGSKVPGVWNMDGVYKSEFFDTTYYVIIGEKLKDNKSKAGHIEEALLDVFDGILNTYDSYKMSEFYTDRRIKKLESEIGKFDAALFPELNDDVLAIARGMNNLRRVGIKYRDLHSGNIMFRGNNPVIIDLGYSNALSQGRIPTFEQIK